MASGEVRVGYCSLGGPEGDPCAELSGEGGASQTRNADIMKRHPSGHLSRKRETAAGWGPPGFPGTCWTPVETHSGTGRESDKGRGVRGCRQGLGGALGGAPPSVRTSTKAILSGSLG